MNINTQHTINWIEQGYIPDNIIRKGIRRLLAQRLDEISANDLQLSTILKQQFIEHMSNSAIAIAPEIANEQHYELPPEFYELVLGNLNKYSCCYWDEMTTTLDQAEINALEKTGQHAGIRNGQNILELGCGWGSLTFWMAENHPDSSITAVSNSHAQRHFIEQHAKNKGLQNIKVITCDMNEFNAEDEYDRIVSVEMFEHIRNWGKLFQHIAHWLKDDGQFFMHIFSHRSTPYAFESKDASDWMSEYFFTGGMMPSTDLPLYFQNELKINRTWCWNGQHYASTADAWLQNMDINKAMLMPILSDTYGNTLAKTWWMRWRIFFMACSELFAYDKGQQWQVMHYSFKKR